MRPNVLFIVVDDLRPALGCYVNGKQKILTPNIDELSSKSFTFEHAYVQVRYACVYYQGTAISLPTFNAKGFLN